MYTNLTYAFYSIKGDCRNFVDDVKMLWRLLSLWVGGL